ncbi:exonuclease domain-containing protein [Saprospiraceae bacterium]|nr:exonuclease domain-containing protein [Saprospiraceae bacterium]
MNFIVYDLEATCWMGRPPGGVNEVIEIGAVKINRYGEILSTFNKFIKPHVNPYLSHFCKKLTSISQENVDRADKFDKVAIQFQEWIDIWDEDYLLCAWGDSDIKLLKSDCNIHKMEEDWLEHNIDIKYQYHSLIHAAKKTGLKSVVKKEGFEFTGIQHRAIADAENTAKIFIKYIDMWRY